MSSIAKIFIVVNLLLSALVLGWASTHLGTADDWKAKYTALQAEMGTTVEEKDAEISGLRGDLSSVQESRDTVRNEMERAVELRDRNRADLDAKTAEANELRARLDSIDSTLEGYASANEQLQARYEQAQSELRTAIEERRDAQDAQEAAEAAQVAAQAALDDANNAIAQMQAASADMQKTISKAETEIAMLQEATGVNAKSLILQPAIDGAVLGVDTSITPGLVAINKGANDNVKKGYTFEVYSGGTYKGKVRVETVQPNMCTAVVLSTFNGAQITQGDRASTKL